MDRRGQLRNVAFGGAWSEQIAGAEALQAAMERLEMAVSETVEHDLREDPAVFEALDLLAAAHPKGAQLSASWIKALMLDLPKRRQEEILWINALIRVGLGKRLGR